MIASSVAVVASFERAPPSSTGIVWQVSVSLPSRPRVSCSKLPPIIRKKSTKEYEWTSWNIWVHVRQTLSTFNVIPPLEVTSTTKRGSTSDHSVNTVKPRCIFNVFHLLLLSIGGPRSGPLFSYTACSDTK